MSIVWYFVALVVLIALSAFFSASEMSYSSANRLRLENAAEDGSRRAKAAVGILDHYDRALSAILIGNNLVNIASSSLGSVIVILLAGEQWTWVSTVVLTLLVIIFGETMPKIVAKQNANGIALRNAYVIRALSIVLYPVIWLVVGLVHLITRPLRGDTGDGDPGGGRLAGAAVDHRDCRGRGRARRGPQRAAALRARLFRHQRERGHDRPRRHGRHRHRRRLGRDPARHRRIDVFPPAGLLRQCGQHHRIFCTSTAFSRP